MQFKAEIGKNGVFVSLDDAIEGKSFHGEMKLEAECGEDWDLIESDKNLIKIEAEVRTNPQFHAYAEPIAAICDYDNGRYKIKINSQVNQKAKIIIHFFLMIYKVIFFQGVTFVQEAVAYALKINQSCVSVSVDRIGGGFGGKGSKSTYWGVAVAIASKFVKV